MNKKLIIKETISFVQKVHMDDPTGHDWWHISRVLKTARHIAKEEKDADLFKIELAALLHDVGDYKTQKDGKDRQKKLITNYLFSQHITKEVIEQVLEIILSMSYSKNILKMKKLSKEGQIVQDADRLDSLGAIGIARAFAYGGKKGRVIYDPNRKPQKHTSTSSYRKDDGHTINHFYEKILLVKDLMNTKEGKKMAIKRHAFILKFLQEFYNEWNGKE